MGVACRGKNTKPLHPAKKGNSKSACESRGRADGRCTFVEILITHSASHSHTEVTHTWQVWTSAGELSVPMRARSARAALSHKPIQRFCSTAILIISC